MCSGPYVCPLCAGTRLSKSGPCQVCHGTGVLWGPDSDPELLAGVGRAFDQRDAELAMGRRVAQTQGRGTTYEHGEERSYKIGCRCKPCVQAHREHLETKAQERIARKAAEA